MKKGSITVFLSLILILVFSFVLTTLEAARIRGATAYVSMLSELAGDSFLASYYYPLFKEYGLFGVDRGDENGFFEEGRLVEELEKNVVYGVEELSGGLLDFQKTEIELVDYKTMLSDGDREFLSQIRQQAALDGISLALNKIFSEELFTEAGMIGEIYRRQEEALEEAATVTEELLQLMELADGIRMDKQGIAFDASGRLQTEEFFIKQLAVMEQEEVVAAYDNAEVFRAVSSGFYRADRAADRIQSYVFAVEELELDIAGTEQRITEYQTALSALELAWKTEKQVQEQVEHPDYTELLRLEKEIEQIKQSLADAEAERKTYEKCRENALSKAVKEYEYLKQKLEAVEKLTEKALGIVDKLEKKQLAAQVAVKAYETYLEGIKNKLSEGLCQTLYKELETMKVYAGLEDGGFSVDTMRRSLETDRGLLQELALSGFSENGLSLVEEEMSRILRRMGEYTVEGLWFPYGNIRVAETTGDIVTGALTELLTAGILNLVGVSGEEVSDRSLSGINLPSAGLPQENLIQELLICIEETEALLRGNSIGEALKDAGNALLDGTALELYATKQFHFFGEEAPYTKLNYEREYLLFGAKEDKTNLLYMVLSLVAVRTLFSMVMILKQPDRMASLDAVSAGVAGFTGIPVLAAVVKYSLLLLWSVEEALVEVSALLQGKRVAVVGTGIVEFGEIFLCGKERIAQKAQLLPDGMGASYRDYLALLSLTKGTEEKAYRAMDLIQENIRYRYRDSFRIRNLVTEISFNTGMELKKQFDTGIFPETAYVLQWNTETAY